MFLVHFSRISQKGNGSPRLQSSLAADRRSEDCRAVALAKADRFERAMRLATSFDSAGQFHFSRIVRAVTPARRWVERGQKMVRAL
jgi:hypothetical protein